MYMFEIVIDWDEVIDMWICKYDYGCIWLWKHCCETVMIMDLLIYTSIVCVWRNSMGLMGRFHGGVILVYALDYGLK